MFVQTIYQSKSRMRIKPNDLLEITAQSLPNNVEHGITSYLYYDDWNYLHIIEGRAAKVAEAMKHIAFDKRHHSLKVRLMTRCSKRNFEDWPFGVVAAEDFEVRRIVRNLGYSDLLQANILDVVKALKRTAGRKYRTMSALEKRAIYDVDAVDIPKPKLNLTEDVLGLRSQ